MAPPVEGRVVDSETMDPLQHAKVVRRIVRLDRDRVTSTDDQGDFSFPKDKDLGWLLMVDYAANQIMYRVEAGGYRPFETNLYGGGSFYRGSLPHDLGVIQLHKESDKIDQTVLRTEASRFAQRQIERHRRLAPVADLGVSLRRVPATI